MQRRKFLKLKASVATASLIGLSGCLAEAETALVDRLSENGDNSSFALSNPKGEKIGERVFGGRSYITKIEYFDGGFVDVHLVPDHNRSRIGVQHHMISWGPVGDEFVRAYRVWELPQFSGPATYDLKSVLMRNGPYPDNIFKFRIEYEDGIIDVGVGGPTKEVSFDVPIDFVPEGTPLVLT